VEGFHGNWDRVFVWEMGVRGSCGWMLRILAGFLDVAMKPRGSRVGFRIL
jgi:hypothetical protein